MFELLLHELRVRAGAVVGWSVGLSTYVAVYLGIYPEVERQLGESAAAAKFFSLYRAVGVEVGSFEAYLASAVVQFLAILLGIYAILDGTDTLAGEEDRGTLELLVAMPLARWRIVTAKAIAMILAALTVLALTGLVAVAIFTSLRITAVVSAVEVFMGVMSVWPIVVGFMMISLFLGAFLPTRRVASMTATIVFAASYFAERFIVFAESLRPVSRWSLFHYFNATATLFTDGVKAGDLIVLFGTGAVFFVLSLVCFLRRDVTTRAWPWRRSLAART